MYPYVLCLGMFPMHDAFDSVMHSIPCVYHPTYSPSKWPTSWVQVEYSRPIKGQHLIVFIGNA